MPTLRQERLADALIANSKRKKPYNKGELLESVGYSRTIAKNEPLRTIEQVGVKQALKARGFTLEGAKAVVQQIMYSPKTRDENRLRATEQVFKVLGAYTEKHINVNVDGSQIAKMLDVLEGKDTPAIAPRCDMSDENKKEVS